MSKILEDLVRCGVPSETIIAVARLEADAELTQKRRQYNMSRMRNVRQRGTTETHTEQPKAGIEKKERKKEKQYTPRKRMLEADFTPDRAFAQAKGWSELTIDLEINRFKDHARATGRRQLDWAAAWRNWVTSPFQTNGGGNGGRSPAEPRKGSREDRQERTSYAVAKLSDYPPANYQGGGSFDDAVPPVGLPLPKPDGS